jgi:hypothetical protein
MTSVFLARTSSFDGCFHMALLADLFQNNWLAVFLCRSCFADVTSPVIATVMSISGISSEVEAILPPPPPRKDRHPVVNATLNHFFVKDDGQEYLTRDVGVENLRKFPSKNKLKTTSFPHRSLSGRGQLNQSLSELLLMKARRVNGEPDPWSKEKKADEKKKTSVNRFRLANVGFSDHLRSAVLQVGRLTKEELDEWKKKARYCMNWFVRRYQWMNTRRCISR